MSKSRDAFRTISEVSDVLDTPAHVLRFWESKFAQVKPVKRAGGRRYYRPGDVELLAGIKQLLHDDGMTIKGAQKLLREQGVKHVAALGAAALDSPAEAKVVDAAPKEATPAPKAAEPAPTPEPEPEASVDITNVVTLPASKPADGPALSLNLSAKEPAQEATPKADDSAPAIPAINVPNDPADNDSRLSARFFDHLHKASHDGLAAQAEAIAPLLDRMQVLRDRISTR